MGESLKIKNVYFGSIDKKSLKIRDNKNAKGK
jgi:hypothetical protein